MDVIKGTVQRLLSPSSSSDPRTWEDYENVIKRVLQTFSFESGSTILNPYPQILQDIPVEWKGKVETWFRKKDTKSYIKAISTMALFALALDWQRKDNKGKFLNLVHPEYRGLGKQSRPVFCLKVKPDSDHEECWGYFMARLSILTEAYQYDFEIRVKNKTTHL